MKRYFKLTNQHHTCFGNDGGFSIVSVEYKENRLKVCTIKGMDFSRDGLLAILQNFYKKEVKIAYGFANRHYKYYKKNIKEKMSGAKDLYITFLEQLDGDIMYKKTTKVLRITCADKIGYAEIFLPHFVLFLPELVDVFPSQVQVMELVALDTSNFTNIEDEKTNTFIENFVGGNIEFTYIEGIHEDSDSDDSETYTWIVPENLIEKVEVGKIATVETCYGVAKVKIVSVKKSKAHYNHKKVLNINEDDINEDELPFF